MRLVSLLVCTLVSRLACGQLAGVITDERTQKPIAAAEVFIHGRSVSTFTDPEGKFQLDGISPGYANVVLYRKGYSLFKSTIRIDTGKRYEVNLTLKPAARQDGKRQSLSAELLKQFTKSLPGSGDLELVNPSVLSLVENKAGKWLEADEPLIIINSKLGYRVRYHLLKTPWSAAPFTPTGYFTFEGISPSLSKDIIDQARHRVAAYKGSLQHLLQSLVSGTTQAEGFVFSSPIEVKPSIANYFTLTGEPTITVTFDGVSSSLKMEGPLQTSRDGILLIPQNVTVTGVMAEKSAPFVLPQDYVPVIPGADDFMQFYERIYVHTDKPYYYPGEPLWFKGYVNYYKPSLRDSLSRVVYVEFIDPDKKILLTRTLRIDQGLFHGDFILPDSLTHGGYYLRAYTRLSRNYGDEHLFAKSIPVLSMIDRADHQQGVNEPTVDRNVILRPDKQVYKTREKITLTLHMADASLAGNVSVSVTDAVQVVDVPSTHGILNDYPIERGKLFGEIELRYPVEFGVSYAGRFLNDNGKPARTNLTIMQLKPRNVLFAETDADGYFTQTGLQFYDTASFSFKSDKAKNFPYGKVEILPRQSAPMVGLPETLPVVIQHTGESQRLISEYEVPKDTKLLDAVTITSRRVEEEVKPIRMYGAGDYSIDDKGVKIGYPNLLYSLVGKPGLYVSPGQGIVKFTRSMNQSIFNGRGPLVVLNDVPMSGEAGDVLSTIDPGNVSSIEIYRRVKPIFGSEGAFGVISVYTKNGLSGTTGASTPNFQTIRLSGYSRSRIFRSPDYDDPSTDKTRPDYRATLYWNPDVSIDQGPTNLSFFSSDLAGYYRVVVEGVLSNGQPVRLVQMIQVEDR